MNEGGEQEADLINSFFLPGGILDPISYTDKEEEEEDAQVPFALQQSQKNPWADSRPSTWNPPTASSRLTHPDEPTTTLTADADPARPLSPPPSLLSAGPVGTGRILSSLNDFAALSDAVGGEELPMRRSSYPVPTRPLHEMLGSPEYHQQSIPAPARPDYPVSSSLAAPHPSLGDAPPMSNSGHERSSVSTPPGFEETDPDQQVIVSQQASQEHDQDDLGDDPDHVDEDSDRSNSSVPHDVFDEDKSEAEASATSSLSASTYENTAGDTSSGSHFFEEQTETTESNNDKDAKGGAAANKKPGGNGSKVERETLANRPDSSRDSAVQTPIPSRPRQARKKSKKHVSPMRKRAEVKTKSEKSSKVISKQEPTPSKSTLSDGPSLPALILEAGKALAELFGALLEAAYGFFVSLVTNAVPFFFSLGSGARHAAYLYLFGLAVAYSLIDLLGESIWKERHNLMTLACFLTLYWLPVAISICMSSMVLPHWTPHLVSGMAIYCFCLPGNDGQYGKQKRRTARKGLERNDRGSVASRCILRCIRYGSVVYFFFCASFEGYFLHPDGHLWSILERNDAALSLVLAFVITVCRSELIMSPVVWICAAVQVLMVQYLTPDLVSNDFTSGLAVTRVLIHIVIAFIGVSSIRLARFLHSEAVFATS